MKVKIRGPLTPGQKVLRQAPASGLWPVEFRYYNPEGEPFEMETELTPWLQLRLRDGDIEIVPKRAPQAAPAKKGKE